MMTTMFIPISGTTFGVSFLDGLVHERKKKGDTHSA